MAEKNNISLALKLKIKEFVTKLKQSAQSIKAFSEKATKSLSKTSKSTKDLTNENKKLRQSTAKLKAETDKASRSQQALSRTISKTSKRSSKLFKVLSRPLTALFSSAVIIYKFISAITQATKDLRSYEEAIGQINSLFSGEGGLTESTKRFIELQSLTFGKSVQDQAKAYYQIVSAGFQNQQEANKILEQANIAAIAGATDVATAVTAITASLNAFKGTSLTATRSLDIMFQTVKDGNLIFSELSKSMGQLLPIARATGISIEEAFGSVSTLTKSGIRVSEAVTQVKGILTSFLKPSEEAKFAIEQLGVSWNKEALQAKGLSGVLGDLGTALAGVKDKERVLTRIIPRVRGLVGTFALMAEGGAELKKTIDNLNKSEGAAVDALADMQTETLALNQAIEKNKKAWRETAESLVKVQIIWTNFSTKTLAPLAKWFLESPTHIKAWKNTIVKEFSAVLKVASVALLPFGRSKQGSKAVNDIVASKKEEFKRLRILSKKHRKEELQDTLKAAIEKQLIEQKSFNQKKLALEAQAREEEKIKAKILKEKPELRTLKTLQEAKEEETINKGRIKFIKQTETAIKNLYQTTLDKVSEGIKKIEELSINAIKKIKSAFSGASFKSLGGAKQTLAGNQSAQNNFKSFQRDITDTNKLTAQGIEQLAKASVEFDTLGYEGQEAVRSMLDEFRKFKGEVDASDIAGAVQASKLGLGNDQLSQELISLFKNSVLGQVDDEKERAEKQKDELILEGLRSFNLSQERIIEKSIQSINEFDLSVKDFRDSARIQQEASQNLLEASNKTLQISFKGSFSQHLDAILEKSRQNSTGNQQR